MRSRKKREQEELQRKEKNLWEESNLQTIKKNSVTSGDIV
jgi:ribosomal protein S20